MSIHYNNYVNLLFTGIIALFPVVNPIGSAFIVSPYFADLDRSGKRNAVKKITFYAFCICTVSLFAGHWILELFGLSVPVVQLAGGIMICKMGWEFLTSDDKGPDQKSRGQQPGTTDGYLSIEDRLFYPITFPVTTGAGTISVLFTLSAHSSSANYSDYLVNASAILLAIIVMCVLVYVFYLNTKTLINYLGSKGEAIVNRITSFLVFCVGLQIAISGIRSIIKA
ncbi:MAG: MarC family protein [Puia sp.]|nr:MarC family protein [Puia sp.]